MIPKIVFKYSEIYDKILKEENIGKRRTKILSSLEIINYIKKIEKLWKKDERKILKDFTEILLLNWDEEKIYCYVVGNSIPFSDPLTIPAYHKLPTYFIDILIHELIHRLFDQPINSQKMQKAWKHFSQKHKKESIITKNHILLHAVYVCVLLKFYNKRRLKREIDLISYLPSYKRSWEIVLNTGHKNIINEFINLVKN